MCTVCVFSLTHAIIIFVPPVLTFKVIQAELEDEDIIDEHESSAIFKMAVGMIIMSFSFLVLMGAVYDASLSAIGKSPVYWLLIAYFMHVVAELSISPVALSFITKLAPAKYASIMMGVYFAITGLGNKAAGMLGEAAQDAGELAVFGVIAGPVS